MSLDFQWPVPHSLVGFSPIDGLVTFHVASCSVKHPVWEKLYHTPEEPFPSSVSLILTVFRQIAIIQFTPRRTVFHKSGQCPTVPKVAACVAGEVLPVSVHRMLQQNAWWYHWSSLQQVPSPPYTLSYSSPHFIQFLASTILPRLPVWLPWAWTELTDVDNSIRFHLGCVQIQPTTAVLCWVSSNLLF